MTIKNLFVYIFTLSVWKNLHISKQKKKQKKDKLRMYSRSITPPPPPPLKAPACFWTDQSSLPTCVRTLWMAPGFIRLKMMVK